MGLKVGQLRDKHLVEIFSKALFRLIESYDQEENIGVVTTCHDQNYIIFNDRGKLVLAKAEPEMNDGDIIVFSSKEEEKRPDEGINFLDPEIYQNQ